MVKKVLITFLIIMTGWIFPPWLQAQFPEKDSLLLQLVNFRNNPGYEEDSNYINTLNELAFRNNNINPDTTILLSKQSVDLCSRISFCRGKSDAFKNLGLAYNLKGDYINALQNFAEALQTATACGYTKGAGRVYHNLGIVYSNMGKYPESLENYFQALRMREEIADTLGISSSTGGIGSVYFMQGKYIDALASYQKALALAQKINYTTGIESNYANIGEVFYRQGNYEDAKKNLLQSMQLTDITGNKETKAFINYILASIHLKQGDYTSAKNIFEVAKRLATEIGSREYEIRSNYGMSETAIRENNFTIALALTKEGMEKARQIGYNELVRDGNEILSRIYEKQQNHTLALYHYKQFKLHADSINNQQSEQRTRNLEADYEYSKKEILIKADQEKKEISYQRKSNQQKWIIFSVVAALFSSLVVAGLIYRSRLQEKKGNILLQRKNIEIDNQKTAVEKVLTDLKAAQQQLIQSEKMASLGELTTGIAHEIQNPLNFVNNFSDVSTELVDEMNEEIEKGNLEDAKQIAQDLKQNLEKINHHGKRAGDIVKGMLQHSRTSSGQKELTDINALADEYLRLAYHGLRAKDKTFNAATKTDYDENIGLIKVIPQDMGRVVLNLINNAFYAVSERKKLNQPSYEPTVSVSTFKDGNTIRIKVIDNGTGIPQKVLDKIFQPFFTTKPTGQGTGLGLSLSYDIVTKGHGGELKVETKEGDGSTFIIQLPLNTSVNEKRSEAV